MRYVNVLSSIVIASSFMVGCSAIDAATKATILAKGTVGNSNIEYAFTQAHQHPENLLEKVIDSSTKTIDIACYSLTKKDIVDTIIAAKNRGVKVRVITDNLEAKNKYQAKELSRLLDNGIEVKENSHSGLMHMKVTISDQSVLTTGSYNYTNAASKVNDENIVVIHNPQMAKDWDNEFNTMWNDTSNFQDVK